MVIASEVIKWLRVVVLLLCCGLATYSDLRKGKIYNKQVFAFFIAALIFDIIDYIFIDRYERIPFLSFAGLLIPIAILLYLVHIWAGGDTKLMIVVSLIFPVMAGGDFRVSLVLAGILILTVFAAGFIYLLVESIVCFIQKHSEFEPKTFLKQLGFLAVRYLITLIFISTLSHIYELCIVPFFNVPEIIFSCVCVAVVIILNMLDVYSKKWIVLGVVGVDIVLTLILKSFTLVYYWKTYLIVIFAFSIQLFVNQYNYKSIPTADVKEGMVLSKGTTLFFANSRIKSLPEDSDETLKSRLTAEEADSVRRWGKSAKGLTEIVIVRKIPFAIFILIGSLLTFLFEEFLLW